MATYGSLSPAQRKLLDDLYGESAGVRAISLETGYQVHGKRRQTAWNLRDKGLVQVEPGRYAPRCWLTPRGLVVRREVELHRRMVRRGGWF